MDTAMSFASADSRQSLGSSDGFSLLETIVALGILAVVAAGVLPLALLAVTTTENQGHLMARTTEYAQDKLEQLQVLAFNDSTSDTRVFPATASGGTGLTPGGSANAAAPVASYVDYLDINGNVLDAPGGNPPNTWFYRRVWQISMVAAANPTCPALLAPNGCLKRITVSATVRAAAAGGLGLVPRATVSSLKTYPF
jgi:prepilin-type N-terminal cleavage/methylation domain-containing protein